MTILRSQGQQFQIMGECGQLVATINTGFSPTGSKPDSGTWWATLREYTTAGKTPEEAVSKLLGWLQTIIVTAANDPDVHEANEYAFSQMEDFYRQNPSNNALERFYTAHGRTAEGKPMKPKPQYTLRPWEEIQGPIGPPQGTAPAQAGGDPSFCDHANENPAFCNCEADCYCKTRTCEKRGS